MRRRLLFNLVAFFMLVAGTAAVLCAAKPVGGGEAGPFSGETRDAMLLLESGPLHVRLHVTLDGRSLSEAREEYVNQLIESLDVNGDGRLTRAEADRSPLLVRKRRESAREFIQSLDVKQVVGRRKIEQTVQRVGGETVVYRQDTSSAETDLEVFEFLDGNDSGAVEPQEMLAAGDRIMQRDRDRDKCVSFREFLPEPETPQGLQLVSVAEDGEDEPRPTVARLLQDTGSPLLPLEMLRRYDEDRDEHLSPAELNWPAARIASIDRDGDGRLSEDELQSIDGTPVDLHLAVELGASGKETTGLQVISTSGDRADRTDRADFARVTFPGAVLTLSYRRVEPIRKALEQAVRVFNELDVDANGYLDEEETADRVRFQRGLFDSMDADNDGRVFAEEMERYVRGRCRPAATSCRINIHDTGHGFFQALDLNGDGRISIREMRSARQSLATMDRDDQPGLAPEEPTRHFHIEFVRGSFQLFGRNDQMIARGPKFEKYVPVGPVWFQRMDRNADGDLTWDEFLGPRIDFDRLDRDRDRLIDPQEAQAAGGGE